jgi:hypothetical protein
LSLAVLPLALVEAQPSQDAIEQQVLAPAVNYLLENYNASVGLVRNSPDSISLRNSYYLYSDNFLTSLVFWNYDTDNVTLTRVAQNITATMRPFLAGKPNPNNEYEVLNASVFSFYAARDYTLYSSGEEYIMTTIDNQSSTALNPAQYADIGFLEAIYYHELGHVGAASIAYHDALATWDGMGFKDSAFSDGQYQTYKLALYIYASKTLEVPYYSQAFNQLIDLQATNGTDKGGFYTCYGSNRMDDGCYTNAETTALAVLALNLADPAASDSLTSWTQEMTMHIEIAAAFAVGLLAVGLTLKRFSR